MSHEAIAAALARDDLRGGERLVAFALASYADRDARAKPGVLAVAARSGLSRSRYAHDRAQLVARGLVVVEEAATGRGRSSTLALPFVAEGPWWDGDINAELFERVLSRSKLRGPARLLVAALAALAGTDGVVRDVSIDELCAAAGVEDRTYRRARPDLLAGAEVVLVHEARGRGNTNVWQVQVDAAATASTARSRRRVVPPARARPLVAAVPATDGADSASDPDVAASERDSAVSGHNGNRPDLSGVSAAKGGQDRTVPGGKGPVRSGFSGRKAGQAGTLFGSPAAENPAQNPAENPAPNARTGREPLNPRTRNPPNPPAGGSPPDDVFVEQEYVTESGKRRRRRLVRIDLDDVRRGLGKPTGSDQERWREVRRLIEERIGPEEFAFRLGQLDLIAVEGDDAGGRRLVLGLDTPTAAWTRKRFRRLIEQCAERVGRTARFAEDLELKAFAASEPDRQMGSSNRQEATG